MKTHFLAIATLLIIQSCSNSKKDEAQTESYSTVSADEKPELSMSAVEFDSTILDESFAASLNGKVVEISGKVVKTHSIADGGDTEKGAHYIKVDGENGGTSSEGILCFFGSSQEALMGKTVKIKGHFFYEDGYSGLIHCMAVE